MNQRNKTKRMLSGVLLFYILFTCSVYMGLLLSLHLFWYPDWKELSTVNIEALFTIPVRRAVNVFTPLVIVLIVAGAWLWITEKPRKGYLVLLLLILGFSWISAREIIPLNNAIAGSNDNKELQRLLAAWMKMNDYRMYLAIAAWLATVWLLMLYASGRSGSPTTTHATNG